MNLSIYVEKRANKLPGFWACCQSSTEYNLCIQEVGGKHHELSHKAENPDSIIMKPFLITMQGAYFDDGGFSLEV